MTKNMQHIMGGAVLTALALLPSTMAAQQAAEPAGAVYTMSNATDGNEILIFHRATDGTLSAGGRVSTGGLGSGGGLGNQGALALSQDEEWLFAVNAGSNDISSFRITANGLRLADRAPSLGIRPVSLTVFGRWIYVVNAGSDRIVGFSYDGEGRLRPIPGAADPLSGNGTAAAQIQFSRDGDLLVVTEKATNRILVWEVDQAGRARDRKVHQSAGQTPFGFAFGKRHQLFVSEAFGGSAGASALTSYLVSDEGDLDAISRSVATTQTAACWTVLHPDEPLAFVSNTGDASISSYRVGFDGSLSLLFAEAVGTGDGPIDMALTPSGRFLYVLNSRAGSIGDYSVGLDGRLTSLPGSTTGLPAGSNGLVAR